MQDLQNLEVFEIEVLTLFNNIKVLDYLFFGGGTMLRLCHNLNRFSTDFDFWLKPGTDSNLIFNKILDSLKNEYEIQDATEKHYTILFQIRSGNSKRSLKIEIRKEQTDFDWERKIAFSTFANNQVVVKALTLNTMMKNKIEAALSRKIIRDFFDIEFLIKRGISLPNEKEKLKELLNIVNTFKEKDFKVTLGSILDTKDRDFYINNKFSLLKEEIVSTLNRN